MQAFQALVDVQERESNAFVRGLGPNDGLLGLGIPPITLPKSRKETRHEDGRGTEGGGKGQSSQTAGGVKKNEVRRRNQRCRHECSVLIVGRV